MSSPAEKHYEAIMGELAADDTHPMAGTVIDEIIALKGSGQNVAAEATLFAARTAFASDIAEWRRQAAEDAGRTE
jgi:hypothetical protein